MATATVAGIVDTWEGLRANPVFRRSLLPRGVRSILRSPFPRALVLTAAALAVYELFTRYVMSWWPVIVFAVVFWFLVKAMQRYFCWLELTALARNGTLADYLNSGLSRADVALGVAYPAVIAETVAVTGVLAWFLVGEDDRIMQTVLIVFVVLNVMSLRSEPFLFHPDMEAYLRRRNPVSLFLIGFAVAVPLVIWFAIALPITFAAAVAIAMLKLPLPPATASVVGIAAAWVLQRWPQQWFATWRLKRFYRRYRSFDDLFQRYIEQQ